MVTRAELVDAAKDLNKVCDLTPPIDVKQGVEALRAQVAEAIEFLREEDELEPGTRKVVNAMRGIVDPDDLNISDEGEGEGEESAPAGGDVAVAEEKEKVAKPVKARKEKRALAPKTPKKKIVKAPKGKIAKKSSSVRGARSAGKPSKGRDEFRPLREDTIRGNIFSRMDGSRTIADIATELHLTSPNTSSHIHCLWRDCGIGFSFDDAKRVIAVLPHGVDSAFRSA